MTMQRHELVDALEAFVLDQLDDSTSDAYERALRDHPDLATEVAELREALAGLAHDDRSRTPPGLRNAILDAATRRRPPGIDDRLTTGASAPECHRATVEIVSTVVDDLARSDWNKTTVYGIPVIELIRHLNGVEQQLAQSFASPTPDPLEGLAPDVHRDVRDEAVDDDVVDAWRRHSGALRAMLTRSAQPDGRTFDVAGIAMSADQLIVVRAFEQWSHAEDICRAIGRPLVVPPAAVLHTMADHAIDLLLANVATHTQRPSATVRVTLTGSGGGSWLRRLGTPTTAAPHDPFTPADATVVADIVDFCRLLADRADDDLRVERLGDLDVCDDILGLAPSLADYGAGPLH